MHKIQPSCTAPRTAYLRLHNFPIHLANCRHVCPVQPRFNQEPETLRENSVCTSVNQIPLILNRGGHGWAWEGIHHILRAEMQSSCNWQLRLFPENPAPSRTNGAQAA